jgi:hypothetical protein
VSIEAPSRSSSIASHGATASGKTARCSALVRHVPRCQSRARTTDSGTSLRHAALSSITAHLAVAAIARMHDDVTDVKVAQVERRIGVRHVGARDAKVKHWR